MLFCTHCGNSVGEGDRYCSRCGGAQQPESAPPPKGSGFEFLESVSERTASMLCYIPFVGWLASILLLAAPTFRHNLVVRFHAFQGLYLFVVWLLVDWVIQPVLHSVPSPGPMRMVSGMLQMGVIAAWVWMIIKTSQEQMFRLPIVGELADRSVAEQR